eukprot:1148542-Pelagomonas_calceolata.AAC.2
MQAAAPQKGCLQWRPALGVRASDWRTAQSRGPGPPSCSSAFVNTTKGCTHHNTKGYNRAVVRP